MSTCDCRRAESNKFARLFIDIASALVKESEFEGKIALRQAIRMYGGTIGRMRKEFMINAGQKTNLKQKQCLLRLQVILLKKSLLKGLNI